jgi:hypothetical protein
MNSCGCIACTAAMGTIPIDMEHVAVSNHHFSPSFSSILKI